MRYGRKFHAAVRIQGWWLRKKRKFRIYKNLYQLMDEYSVEGGFTGRDSAKYLGIGKGKNLLNIQEDIMNKVLARRIKCKEMSKKFIKTVFRGVFHRQLKRAYKKNVGETVYGFGSCARWAEDGGTEPYLCASCATTNHSSPGDGRASGNLMHPRWEAQCYKCWKENPYYKTLKMTLPSVPTYTPYLKDETMDWCKISPTTCDPGVQGDEGPKSQFLGKWGRRLGLHQT